MNYALIRNCDIANGEGVRVSLFVSGCTHHCKGCFNEEAWDFAYGKPFTVETEEQLLDLLSPSYIAGLTLLGGEPMEPENQRALVPFCGACAIFSATPRRYGCIRAANMKSILCVILRPRAGARKSGMNSWL